MEIDLSDLQIALKVEGGSLVAALQYKGEVISQDRVTLPRIPEPTFGPLPKDNTTYQYTGPTLLDLVRLVGDPKVTVSVPVKTDARSTITLNDKGEVEH